MSAIAEAVAEATARLLAHYNDADITPGLRAKIVRVAELQTLAGRMRATAISGDEFYIGDLTRLESLADEALRDLALPASLPRKPVVEIAPVEGAKPPDLSRLSDCQLQHLDRLVSIACGAPAPEPLRTPLPSWRNENAVALACVIDAALGAVAPRVRPDLIEIDDAVLERVKTLLHRILWPLPVGRVAHHSEISAAMRVAERRAIDAEKRAEHAEARLTGGAGVPAPARGNVVTLPPRLFLDPACPVVG